MDQLAEVFAAALEVFVRIVACAGWREENDVARSRHLSCGSNGIRQRFDSRDRDVALVRLAAERFLEEARHTERTAWRHAEALREQAVREMAAEQRRTAALVEAMEDVRRMIAPLSAAIGTIDAAIQHHWADG